MRDRAISPPRSWVRPEVIKLPRLTELTLQTGVGIPGACDCPGAGSVLIP